MNITLAKTLYRWAKNCEENQETLHDWFNEAVSKMASGQGKDIASVQGNGMSTAFTSGSMSIADWCSTLGKALEYLDNPSSGSSKGIVIFR